MENILSPEDITLYGIPPYRTTPLHAAVFRDSFEDVRNILQDTHEMDSPDNIRGWTALDYATAGGRVAIAAMIAQTLLPRASKEQLNSTDRYQVGLLHRVCP